VGAEAVTFATETPSKQRLFAVSFFYSHLHHHTFSSSPTFHNSIPAPTPPTSSFSFPIFSLLPPSTSPPPPSSPPFFLPRNADLPYTPHLNFAFKCNKQIRLSNRDAQRKINVNASQRVSPKTFIKISGNCPRTPCAIADRFGFFIFSFILFPL
jgi:hypothetical protein